MMELRALGRPDVLRAEAPGCWRLKDLAELLNREVGPGWEIHALSRRPDRFRSGCRA